MRDITMRPLDGATAIDEVATRVWKTCSDTTRRAIRTKARAGNDATCEVPTAGGQDVAPRATTQALERVVPQVTRTRPMRKAREVALPAGSSYDVYEAARAHRARVLGDIVVALAREAGRILRDAYARYRQRQVAKATYDALRALDDRSLHDLGFDRSELRSVAAEVAREAELSRARML